MNNNSVIKYFNPHPQEKMVADCVKRALVAATGRTYKEVSSELNRHKKITKSKHFSSKSNFIPYFEEELKFKRISFPAVKGQPRMNGASFARSHRKGTYILNMAHHVVACIDGVLYDTWDSTEKCVYSAWVVKE